MRRSHQKQADKLERALARAHALQEAPEFSPAWHESVMREVRRHPVSIRPRAEVPQLVWRAAAIVSLVSTVFIGSVVTWNVGRTDSNQPEILAELTLDDPPLLSAAP
jgi:hypothetical protein